MATRQKPLAQEQLQRLNEEFEHKSPQALLEWALAEYHPNIALSSSFGAEDVVLIDMLWRINPKARVFTLDTLRLHTETYTVIDQIHAKYGIAVEIYYPDLKKLDEMVQREGYNCFYRSVELRKLCCGIRKVEPLEKALSGLYAWTSGLRRDQAATRTTTGKLEIDEVHNNIVKLNPLAGWTSEQVWDYIRQHDVPYNELHDQGYPSIGCAPCTRAVQPGEDPRAGRWWWESDPNAKECGIHIGWDAAKTPLVLSLDERS